MVQKLGTRPVNSLHSLLITKGWGSVAAAPDGTAARASMVPVDDKETSD